VATLRFGMPLDWTRMTQGLTGVGGCPITPTVVSRRLQGRGGGTPARRDRDDVVACWLAAVLRI